MFVDSQVTRVFVFARAGWHGLQRCAEEEGHFDVAGEGMKAEEPAPTFASAPGTRQIWPQLAAAHARALDAAGESAQAAERGRAYLADAERSELGPSALDWISLASCMVEAKLGRPRAAAMAEALIERCLATGASGLKLGLAYEARARVAIAQGDLEAYERYQRLCEQVFVATENSALLAKLQTLQREGRSSARIRPGRAC